jgi:RHS repeat-associated protein
MSSPKSLQIAILATLLAVTAAQPARAQCELETYTSDICPDPGHPGVTTEERLYACRGGLMWQCATTSEPNCITFEHPCSAVPVCLPCDINSCDGRGDESSCGGGDCSNYISDPVHVGTGAFLTEPSVDVRFSGSDVPIEFIRHYTSHAGWQNPRTDAAGIETEPTRLSQSWFHNFDERLFASDAVSPTIRPVFPTAEPFTIVHRGPAAAGRQFNCPALGSTPASFNCTTTDGSLDVLEWVETGAASEWRIRFATQRVRFDPTGRLVGRGDHAGAQLWNVRYHGSGAYAGQIDQVIDHLGRKLVFVWMTVRGQKLLDRLDDGSGNVLMDFGYDSSGLFLTSVTGAALAETYEYAPGRTPGSQSRYLARILRNGQAVTEVTYTDSFPRRVRTVNAADGQLTFRYPGETTAPFSNTCVNPSRTTQIVNRAQTGIACTLDSQCAASNRVCDSGSCRPYSCQQYFQNGSTVEIGHPEHIAEDCCGGSDELRYTTSTAFPSRTARSQDRAGTITTFAYDTSGRMTARCVNDDGVMDGDGTIAAVTTDPSTCPTSGQFTRWTYGNVGVDVAHPSQVRLEERRSALSNGAFAVTELVYRVTTGRVTRVRRRGYTRSLADANTFEEQVTRYEYSAAFGMLHAILGPAGERTEFEYWGSGTGNNYGMLRYQRQRAGTSSLTTAYSDYTSTGRPQTLVEASGVTRSFTYAYSGQRLLTTTTGGLTTTFTYDAAGRLEDVTEPTGRRTRYSYDASGRLGRSQVYDFPAGGEGVSDRTTYFYDEAGRRTRALLERVSAAGDLQATVQDLQATYDVYGNIRTQTVGPQSPTRFTYDPAAAAYLDQLTRGDGNLEEYQQDAFGRDVYFRRTFAAGVTGQHNFAFAQPSGNETGGSMPTQVTDPAGRVRTYVYDDFDQVVRSQSVEWGTVRWHWRQGRLLDTVWADGRRTAFTYDSAGRLTSIDNDADAPANLGQDYRFNYDNGDSLVPCVTSAYGCRYRRGRLARVQIEYVAGSFWDMYYDYTAFGEIGLERWPDLRESQYTYDPQGRLIRMRFPGNSQDYVRYDYDTTVSDGHDQSEVRQVIGERGSPGTAYVNWGREMAHDASGRLTSVLTHDAYSSVWPQMLFYRTDGRLSRLLARRRNGNGATMLVDRTYAYSVDGTATGYTSAVAADLPRTFFYDGGNRLTCSAKASGLGACPTDGTLIESYVLNAADDRTSRVTSSGTTSYKYLSGGAALYTEELPPARTLQYGSSHGNLGGARTYDIELTAGSPANQRSYTYDSQGRLRVLSMTRPTDSPSSTRELHTISILYDHRSRPLLVSDLNSATTVETRWQYFYDLQDRMVSQITTWNAAAPTNYTLNNYFWIDDWFVGDLRTEYPGGVRTERSFYHVLAPEGLPAVTYEANITTRSTAEMWRGQWTPFGSRLSTTGSNTWNLPFLFRSQLILPSSDAAWWVGNNWFESREPLVLNRWRAYDPRVGGYLQPEPFAIDATRSARHAYGYVGMEPVDRIDPDGRDWRDLLDPTRPFVPLCVQYPELCESPVNDPPGSRHSEMCYDYKPHFGGDHSGCGSTCSESCRGSLWPQRCFAVCYLLCVVF